MPTIIKYMPPPKKGNGDARASNSHDDTAGASFDDRGRGEPLSGRQTALNPIKLLSYAEMVALPEGEFLIQGVIVRRAKNVLFGLSNSFKSFMATDMGGSISTGRTYH